MGKKADNSFYDGALNVLKNGMVRMAACSADLARLAAQHNLVLDRRAGVERQRAQVMAQLKTA